MCRAYLASEEKNCKAHRFHHSDDRQIVRGNGTRLQNWYIPQKNNIITRPLCPSNDIPG